MGLFAMITALKTLEQTFGSTFSSNLALFCSLILLYILRDSTCLCSA